MNEEQPALVLRPATTSDFEAIAALVPSEDELFRVYPRGRHPFSVDQICKLAEERKDLTVAIHQGELVGFANLYDVMTGQHAFVGNVIVGAASRGTGFGRMLVTHMAALAFGKYSLSEVRISVFSENVPALLLYSSLRFRPYAVEERRDPSGKRVALIHMALTNRR